MSEDATTVTHATSEISRSFGHVDHVSKLSGRAKSDYLAQHADDHLKDVIVRAYDPMITYGVKKLPTPDADADPADWSDVALLLDDLSNRELTGLRAQKMIANVLGGLIFSERTLVERILKKDLRWGLNAKSINKAIPGLLRIFEPMLAHKYDLKRIKKWPVGVEEKLDGVRVFALVDLDKNQVRFVSRSGKPFTSFDHLALDVIAAASHFRSLVGLHSSQFVLDGEVISGSFLETVSSVRRKDEAAADALFTVFDVLTEHEFFVTGRSALDYEDRRTILDNLSYTVRNIERVQIAKCELAFDDAQIQAMAGQIIDKGGEGVIVKPLDGYYETKRSHAWLKIKAEESLEARVIDAFEGTGKYEGMLGGVIVRVKGTQVRVGGGFSDREREELWPAFKADRANWRDTDTPMRVVNRLVEIGYHQITPDGSLRHPRFVKFRDTLTGDHE